MSAGFKGVDNDYPKAIKLHRVVNEIIACRQTWEMTSKAAAVIMIANARVNREGTARQNGGRPLVTRGITAIRNVPCDHQQIRTIGTTNQYINDGVQPPAIFLVGITGNKPDMQIGNLRDQHAGLAIPVLFTCEVMQCHQVGGE